MSASPRLLCVDAGNTRVKFGIGTRERWRELGAMPTKHALAAAGEVPKLLRRRQKLLRSVDGAVVSSVVPSLNAALSSALFELCGRQPVFVDHGFRFPFRIGVSPAGQLGVDRLCAAAGALGTRAASAIIVDVGSAITVDLVDRRVFKGGLIMAGPSLGLQALGSFAEQLPTIDYQSLANPFPSRATRTRASMILGASIGAVGAIRQAVGELDRWAGRPVDKALTGGGAPPLRGRLPGSWRFDAGLVQKGLFLLWQLNLAG